MVLVVELRQCQLRCGDNDEGAPVPWGLFPVLWRLLWSLVSLSHLLVCSLLTISSMSVSLLPGAELSPPIFMPSAPQFLPPLLVHFTVVPLSWQAAPCSSNPCPGQRLGQERGRTGTGLGSQHHVPVSFGTLPPRLPGAMPGPQGTSSCPSVPQTG